MYNYDTNLFMTNLYEGVYIVDTQRKIVFWNTGSELITGFSAKEVTQSHCYDNILNHVDASGKQLCFVGCPLQKTLLTGEIQEANVFLHHKEGHRIPVSVRTMPLYDEAGTIVAAVEVFTDMRYQQEAFEENRRLKRMLETDNLTQIYNRQYLEFKLKSAIQESETFETGFAVLFIDIDYFKNINDTYGHNVGDKALRLLSKTLRSNLRPGDIIGRWGGEEFIAIINNVVTDELLIIAERLRVLCSHSSFKHQETEIQMTVSIGGTLYQPGESLDQLVERADKCMYQSKQKGRNQTTIK